MVSVTLSTIAHVGIAIAAFIALTGVDPQQKKPMVVQLVPAVAALGSPRGEVMAPPEAAPRPEPAPATEPPPVKAPSLPERTTPSRIVAPAPSPLAAAVLPA